MSALIAGAAAAAGTAANYFVNSTGHKNSMYRAERINKSLMDYQNDINLQNWHLQNAYNSPSAQMERYRQAGLNPNLIYSQSNEANDVGSVSAGSSSGEYSPVDFSRLGDSYINAYTKVKQVNEYAETQEKEREVMQADINYKAAQTTNMLLGNEKLQFEKPFWSKNARYQSDEFAFRARQIDLDNRQRMWQLLTGNTLTEQKTNAEIEKLKKERDFIAMNESMDRKEKQAKINFLNRQIARYDEIQDSVIALNRASAGNLRQSSNLSRQQFAFNQSMNPKRLKLADYQNDIAEVDANYAAIQKELDMYSRILSNDAHSGHSANRLNVYNDATSINEKIRRGLSKRQKY